MILRREGEFIIHLSNHNLIVLPTPDFQAILGEQNFSPRRIFFQIKEEEAIRVD